MRCLTQAIGRWGHEYSERLLELFQHRGHAGSLAEATHKGAAGLRGQGPFLEMQVRVRDGNVTAAAIAYDEAACRAVEGGAIGHGDRYGGGCDRLDGRGFR